MRMGRVLPLAAFGVISLFWGLTWFTGKIGVTAVPPQFFTSSRFLVAGLLLSAWLALRGQAVWPSRTDLPRVVAVACLTMLVSPGLNFWGLGRTGSGIAGVINLSLTPMVLYLVGQLTGLERRNAGLDLALALGLLGLALLFAPRLQGLSPDLLGLAAIVVGTSCLATGSVISRPLAGRYGALPLVASSSLIGGVGLMSVSLLIESPDGATLAAMAEPRVLGSWLFLLLGGSLLAMPLFFWLLREWGPARAGLYAFVSPVIAVVAGMLVLDERADPIEALGMAAMLAATWIALRHRA